MKNLQFCQQCAVHHKVQFHQGQTAFSSCESKVQQHLNSQPAKIQSEFMCYDQDVLLVPPQSLDSIDYQLQPQQKYENNAIVCFSSSSLQSSNISKLAFNEKRVLLDSENLQSIPKAKINILNPPRPIFKAKVAQKVSKVAKMDTLIDHFKNALLSTIKEQRYQSSRSSSVSYTTFYPQVYISKSPSNQKRIPSNLQRPIYRKQSTRKSPSYKFKNLKGNYEKANANLCDQNCCW